jgi:hypothetical protein
MTRQEYVLKCGVERFGELQYIFTYLLSPISPLRFALQTPQLSTNTTQVAALFETSFSTRSMSS